MKLKLKKLNWEAGRPVAILNKHTAEKNDIHPDDRILIKKNSKSVIAVVDTASGVLKENQIILSKEILNHLPFEKNSTVEIDLAEKPESIALIHKKIDKEILSGAELKQIMKDIANNALTESEIAYLISSIYNNKLNMKETANLTKAIVETGQVLKFKGKVADKHCLPFDTPVLVKEDGITRLAKIGEIVEFSLINKKKNIRVFSWNDNYKTIFTPIKNFYKVKSPKNLIEINLIGNRKLTLTDEHTVFILKDGKIVNVPSNDISKGNYILVPCNFKSNKKTNPLKLVFKDNQKKNKLINKKIELTKELMRFLGYYLSEGFSNYQGIFLNFGSHEKDLIEDAKHCIKKVFGVTPTLNYPHKTAIRLSLYSRELSNSFKKVFECGNLASEKSIPSFIFDLNKSLTLEFIRALFKGDGYIRRGYEVVYVTVSENLANQLCYLLSFIGASSSLSIRKQGFRFMFNKNYPTKKTYFIYTQAREIFGGRQKDNVAFINLLPVKELGEIEKEKIGWEFRRNLKKQKYITKQKISKIRKHIKSEDIKKIINSDISVLEVKNIEKINSTSDYVYDLKTKEGRFIAGFMPICIHNSIGGVPGRTTPIVVSICASTGLKIPKTSSRAITTPSGTADAMEVLCKVDLSISEVKKIVNKINACLVWGGSLNLAPADDKIIHVERILNLDPESQLLASIMSKKISVGAKYVVIDIPYGKTAKVTKAGALRLKRKFQILGKHFGIKVKSILFKTEEPVGNGIGPALEIIDVIKVLRREDSCHKLEEKSLILSGELLELTRKAKKGEGLKLAAEILNSGLALKKFQQIIESQKGKLKIPNKFKFSKNIKSQKSGKIISIDIKKINAIARVAGCPIDKFSGIYLHKHLNDKVSQGEKILTIYSESKNKLASAIRKFKELKPIKPN